MNLLMTCVWLWWPISWPQQLSCPRLGCWKSFQWFPPSQPRHRPGPKGEVGHKSKQVMARYMAVTPDCDPSHARAYILYLYMCLSVGSTSKLYSSLTYSTVPILWATSPPPFAGPNWVKACCRPWQFTRKWDRSRAPSKGAYMNLPADVSWREGQYRYW